MYILIEHNGSEESLKIASVIQDHAEYERGYSCDQVVGHNAPVTIYDMSMKPIATFNSAPSEQDLNFYFNTVNEDGEDQ
tara:strand:- start:326 stop:562 length:237 start_codon:yes stop_codon:yes gene_type:complete